MTRVKQYIIILLILGSLVFLFGPEVIPDDFQPQEILDVAANSDVIIIFNSGGWGNTPLEKAEDFSPIIEGIQETLNEWGYNSVVVPYVRVKDDFTGKITGIKEFFNSFRSSSEDLAEKIEIINKKLPDKKIIIAGLSNGATFAVETYEKISEDAKDSVYAIAAGAPFWIETVKSDNVLQLDNAGKDTLAIGEAKSLLLSLFGAPFRWILTKLDTQNVNFSRISQIAAGHYYSWSSLEVNSQIVTFLGKKFR